MTPLLRRFGCVIDRSGIDRTEFHRRVRIHKPDGLVTYLDAGMVELAELAEFLGLPFCSPATAELLIDKATQRRRLKEAGLSVPACQVLSAEPGEIAIANTDAQVWPAILKPRSAQGSRFMLLASDAARAAAFLDGLGPRRPEMVIEDYLPDDPTRTGGPYAAYLSVETSYLEGNLTISRSPVASPWRPISARRDSSSPPIFKRRKRPTFSNCVPRPSLRLKSRLAAFIPRSSSPPRDPGSSKSMAGSVGEFPRCSNERPESRCLPPRFEWPLANRHRCTEHCRLTESDIDSFSSRRR